MTTARLFTAELLGTFFLCFAGIGSMLSATAAVGAHPTIVGIALAHGLALSIAVATFGGVSGAHVNPAVTAAMLVTRRISAANAVLYVVAQLAGATVAALICKFVFPAAAVAEGNLGLPPAAPWASGGVLFAMEFVLTFLLVTAVFGTAVDERGKAVKIGAFAIGLTVAFDILAGGAVSGASMNPARSFGPALVQGYWTWHLLYWIAPIAGGVTAALLYEHVILEKK
jgi:MIP family channel proteins